MKLHYNADTFSVGKVRKLKTAITAMGVKVEEVVHKTGDDLSKVSFFNTLPLLETPQGTIFSSNTILRFLASAHKPELYEGDVYNKTLIDQWMDFTTCDFEPVVAAILYHKEGRGVDLNKLEQDVTKILAYTNGHLKDKNFLVNNKFSIADITLGASVSVIL